MPHAGLFAAQWRTERRSSSVCLSSVAGRAATRYSRHPVKRFVCHVMLPTYTGMGAMGRTGHPGPVGPSALALHPAGGRVGPLRSGRKRRERGWSPPPARVAECTSVLRVRGTANSIRSWRSPTPSIVR